jgi:hypothetical protein
MSIVAKHIQRSNIVFAYPDRAITLPEPALVFAAYPGAAGKGASFADDSSMMTRIFEFPAVGHMWVFEQNRIRLEDKLIRTPQDSKLGDEMLRVTKTLFGNAVPASFGVNYDIIYRTDVVVPTNDIMGHFLKPTVVEQVKDFGWQYTLVKDKGRRSETYFMKVVSPIEYSMHANIQWNGEGMPTSEDLAKKFIESYKSADEGIEHIHHVNN